MQRMLAEPDLGSGCSPAASLPAMPWCYALLCPAAPSPPCPDCQCMHQDSQKAPGRGIPWRYSWTRAAYKLGTVTSLSLLETQPSPPPGKCTVCREMQGWVEITFRGKIRKYLLFHNKNKFLYNIHQFLKNFCSKVIYNLTNKQQFMLRTLIRWGFFLASVTCWERFPNMVWPRMYF